jgi:hypothetical protein
MKTSFKTTTLIAAIGMMVYTIYGLTRYAIHEFWPIPYHYDLWYDIIERIILDILPISLIFAGVGLWNYCPSNNESQSFRIFTICLFIALIGTLLFSPLYTYSIVGLEYIFPPIFWRAIILISGIVWLFMFRRQPLEETSPRSYRVTLILAMLLLALPMVLEAISGISLLCGRDIVLGLNSGAIKSWVKYIAPILPLVHFVFPRIEKINYMCNNHCIPGSYERRTFNRNRTITLVVVGITIVSFVLAFVSYTLSYRLYYRNLPLYELMHAISSYAGCLTFLAGIISWIMLSIMAFHYLPNPRGYKIYNIVCQFVTWGSLVPAIFAPSNFDEIFGVIFLIFFGAFFLTTTIRVISYSLPK